MFDRTWNAFNWCTLNICNAGMVHLVSFHYLFCLFIRFHPQFQKIFMPLTFNTNWQSQFENGHRTPPANAKADWDTLSGNQSPVKARSSTTLHISATHWSDFFTVVVAKQPKTIHVLHRFTSFYMFTCRQCRMHFTDAFDLFWLSSQVKLIDFDTVETVQPQTPKKAKARDTTSTSDLFSVQLRSTSFDFVRLQLFQGNQMIWHDFSILIWHDLTQTCRVSTDVAMPLHGSWIRLARMCLVQISTLHKRPAHFWLLSIDTSNHMAPRHHWGGYIYIYILTSMKTVVKGKASGQQVLLFPWRPMTETIPLLQTFSQWVWLDTGWKPRVKTNQSRMSRLSPLCYSQKLPYWTSADVRLLTAKFPYRAEIFDDEVWDGLWSSFYQFSYRFFANSTSVETSISITTLQAGDNWVGSPKMKEPMVSGASYWGYQYYTV